MIFASDHFQYSLFVLNMLPARFHAILRRQPFSHTQSRTLISRPSREAPFIIFARDRFQYLLFGLNMLPVRFSAILRQQPFLRAQFRTQKSWPSREHSFYYFRARPLPIFVILPKYATHAISRNSETITFFARPIAHANIPAIPGALRLQFSCATSSNIRYLA